MDVKAFMGKGLKFPLQIDKKTGRLAVVSYEEDIAQSIGIIVRTYEGERVMQEAFGLRVADLLFEAVDKAIVAVETDTMVQRIQSFEPRVMSVTVNLEKIEDDAQSSGLLMTVGYTVRETNNRYNKVYPFYMNSEGKGGE